MGDVIRIHGRREFFSSKIDEYFILTLEKHSFIIMTNIHRKGVKTICQV